MSRLRKSAVELFTPDEHAILARCFGAKPPPSAAHVNVEEAIERFGFTEEPGYRTLVDVAVAFVILENVETRLPQ